MDWGSLIDVLLLTPSRFEAAYAVAPEKYQTEGMECQTEGCVAKGSVTDAQKCGKCRQPRVKVTVEKDWDWNSTTCSEWRDEREKEGQRVIKAATVSDAWKAVARLREDEEISQIMKDAATQVQINVDWHSPSTGLVIPFRCLLDVMPKADLSDTLWDLKTCADASVRKWQRQVYDYELYIQAAIYVMATNAATGSNFKNFGHIIQESGEPYEPVCRILTFEFLNLGKNDFTYAMERYCQCLKSGHFPGYDDAPVDLEAWMIKQI